MWKSSLVPLFSYKEFNLKHCDDSFINLSKNKQTAPGSIIPHLCVTYTKEGLARQQRTGSEPSQLIYTGQNDKLKRMTHLEIKLLQLTCKGQLSHP